MKNNETKIWLFEKIRKIDKSLATNQAKEKKNMRFTNIMNERHDIIQLLQILGG